MLPFDAIARAARKHGIDDLASIHLIAALYYSCVPVKDSSRPADTTSNNVVMFPVYRRNENNDR